MEGVKYKIVFLGSGNVATNLALRLDKQADIIQIWSKNPDNAIALASKLSHAEAISDFKYIAKDADIYIIAVNDAVIGEVASNLKDVKGIVVHTSGSIPLDILKENLNDKACFGVLYPLQTFTKSLVKDNLNIPFFIESFQKETTSELKKVAKLISDDIYIIDSELRKKLHLAAVLANNFSNYIFNLADNFLKNNSEFNLNILKPLLEETIVKAVEIGPSEAQTGPAVRNDRIVIEKHIEMLPTDMKEVYRFLSDRISETYTAKKEILSCNEKSDC